MSDRDEPALVRYSPPPLLGWVVVAVSLGASGWFASRALADARRGQERVAAALLDVDARDATPTPLKLQTLDGKTVSLGDLGDKVVLINFWATWCPPCIAEMPSMTRMYTKLAQDPRFEMLAVSTDESWTPVRELFGKDTPPYPVLLDPNGELSKTYGTTVFPESYVVKGGRIIGFIEGPRAWDEWYAERYLRELMERP